MYFYFLVLICSIFKTAPHHTSYERYCPLYYVFFIKICITMIIYLISLIYFSESSDTQMNGDLSNIIKQ